MKHPGQTVCALVDGAALAGITGLVLLGSTGCTAQPAGPGGSATLRPEPTPVDLSSAVDGDYLGSVYTAPYGDYQVQATIVDGQITAIEWLALPGDPTSLTINADAAPTLVAEGLRLQSAQVDSVSGASYTSEAFRTSLQAALDQAVG